MDIWTEIGHGLVIGWIIGVGLFVGPWAVRKIKEKFNS